MVGVVKRRKENGSRDQFESKGERRSSRHQKVEEVMEEIEMKKAGNSEPALVNHLLVKSPMMIVLGSGIAVQETIDVQDSIMEVPVKNEEVDTHSDTIVVQLEVAKESEDVEAVLEE